YPDVVLQRKCLPVNDVDGVIRELMDSMAEVMYTYRGIGLAAPQVGMLWRVIIADVGEGLITLVNPEILQKDGNDRLQEGCLSLPDIEVDVERKHSIFVRGIDANGKEASLELAGLIARVIQHEIDHLNGVLITDYASAKENLLIKRKLKALKTQFKARM
ncbi:peptide deformylase, partial [candidate division KSB1 bacterium]|nr:peptide deformylase [candidate division KSB1 bacterium]